MALALSKAALDDAALAHALDVLSEAQPAAVARARQALDAVLDGVRRSRWSDVAWCASSLSPNGYPVQLVLDQEPSVGYVAEVTGPEEPVSAKLGRALDALAELGAPPIAKAQIAPVLAAQRESRLRVGAWLGGCHDAMNDEYMLYIEVPSGTEPAVLDALAPAVLREHLASLGRLQTVGVGAGSGRVEFYSACEPTQADAIAAGMRRLGFGDRVQDLISLVERTPRRPALLQRERRTLGLATTLIDGCPNRFMVVVPARRMLGRDRDVRRRLLTLALQEGWDLSTYSAVTEPLESATERHTSVHGLLAWTIDATHPPSVRVAFAPPR